jgi:hypothetical protein
MSVTLRMEGDNRQGSLTAPFGFSTSCGFGATLIAEVMNRVTRRAAAASRSRPRTIPPIDIAIYIVPMELTEGYYAAYIADEGIGSLEPAIIIMRPEAELGRADHAWLQRTLGQMRDVRQPGTHRYEFPHDGGTIEIDIGLIDVQVWFNDTAGELADDYRSDENFAVLDKLCGSQLNTQMVLASAVHRYRPDGSYLLHYHNLIFSLRKEYDGDCEHLGVIDLLPLVKVLGDGRTLNIIDGL